MKGLASHLLVVPDPGSLNLALGVLNQCTHCLFRKDNSHLHHKLSSEHLTSVFLLSPDKQETEKVVPGSRFLDPFKTMGVGEGGAGLKSLREYNSASSFSLSTMGPRSSESLAFSLWKDQRVSWGLPCFPAGQPGRFHPDCQTLRPQ